MRTAMFLGANIIAMAITQASGIYEVQMSDGTVRIMAYAFIAFMIMDTLDFIKGLTK
jgi:hypothetical protein